MGGKLNLGSLNFMVEQLQDAIMRKLVTAAVLATAFPLLAEAAEIEGPARFCGYSPIIDLLPAEKVTTLEGGIHGGSFRWEGAFGSLEVRGIGWASKPKGRIVEVQTGTKPARFAQRRISKRYEVAIWNGGHGAAYFSSDKPLSAHQLRAISRVQLFEEGQDPSGCKLRTSFSWE
jgi:hypothetical protein